MRCFIIFILVLTVSCSQKNVEEKVLYYIETNRDELISGLRKDFFKYRVIIKDDSVNIFNKNQFIYNLEYKIDKKGIYILKDKKPKLLYSFEINNRIKRDDYLTDFFYDEVELIGKKAYNINNKNFTIYHFLEYGVSETLDSYYLEDEGFICFYKYDSDDFIYLDSPKAYELSSEFLRDSTFFAQLKLRKLDLQMGRKFD